MGPNLMSRKNRNPVIATAQRTVAAQLARAAQPRAARRPARRRRATRRGRPAAAPSGRT